MGPPGGDVETIRDAKGRTPLEVAVEAREYLITMVSGVPNTHTHTLPLTRTRRATHTHTHTQPRTRPRTHRTDLVGGRELSDELRLEWGWSEECCDLGLVVLFRVAPEHRRHIVGVLDRVRRVLHWELGLHAGAQEHPLDDLVVGLDIESLEDLTR